MDINVGTLRREGGWVLVDVTIRDGATEYPSLEVALMRTPEGAEPGIASYNSSEYLLREENLRAVFARVRQFIAKQETEIAKLLPDPRD